MEWPIPVSNPCDLSQCPSRSSTGASRILFPSRIDQVRPVPRSHYQIISGYSSSPSGRRCGPKATRGGWSHWFMAIAQSHMLSASLSLLSTQRQSLSWSLNIVSRCESDSNQAAVPSVWTDTMSLLQSRHCPGDMTTPEPGKTNTSYPKDG